MIITECPRDAMQGIKDFIPTSTKVSYLNALLKVGFDVLDFGSFVSPKAVPQMRDTADVLAQLDLSSTKTKLLAIVANLRGAEEALEYSEISYLGFPLSVSETFQLRNTNKSIEEALKTVEVIQDKCVQKGKNIVVYLSMAFGNPYGEHFEASQVAVLTQKLEKMGVGIVALSDTVGTANADSLKNLYSLVVPEFSGIQFGVHLHTRPEQAEAKVKLLYELGCERIDVAMKGFGGCPMAKDELVGNLPTEVLVEFLREKGELGSLSYKAFEDAFLETGKVFLQA